MGHWASLGLDLGGLFDLVILKLFVAISSFVVISPFQEAGRVDGVVARWNLAASQQSADTEEATPST